MEWLAWEKHSSFTDPFLNVNTTIAVCFFILSKEETVTRLSSVIAKQTFFSLSWMIWQNKLAFVCGKHFKPSPIFVSGVKQLRVPQDMRRLLALLIISKLAFKNGKGKWLLNYFTCLCKCWGRRGGGEVYWHKFPLGIVKKFHWLFDTVCG
jgi:hypothetical protein